VIGYVAVEKLNGKFIGGLLVVDGRGIPQEFKYTEPIVPNELQRILYGKSLDVFLKTEIIAATLVKKLEKAVDFIFTKDLELLEVDQRIVFLSERREEIREVRKISEEEYLVPYKEGALRIIGKVSLDKLKKLSELLDEGLDIFEPFERLERALEYLCSGT